MMKLNVVCLYRTGGKKYNRKDVTLLREAVENALRDVPHTFTCLTNDTKWPTPHPFSLSVRPNLPPGWWGKPYVFEIRGPALFLDLDTSLPLNDAPNLAEFGQLILRVEQSVTLPRIWMLTAFRWSRGVTTNPIQQWNSSIMAWAGDWSWIAKEFRYPYHADIHRWDQRFLSRVLADRDIPVSAIQDHLKVYSYKWHCRDGVPADADIVCFHGNKTPRTVLV